MDYLIQKRTGTWDIKASTQRGNKVGTISGQRLGYKDALPWADEIDSFDLSPLYDCIDALREEPEEEVFPWRPPVRERAQQDVSS